MENQEEFQMKSVTNVSIPVMNWTHSIEIFGEKHFTSSFFFSSVDFVLFFFVEFNLFFWRNEWENRSALCVYWFVKLALYSFVRFKFFTMICVCVSLLFFEFLSQSDCRTENSIVFKIEFFFVVFVVCVFNVFGQTEKPKIITCI